MGGERGKRGGDFESSCLDQPVAEGSKREKMSLPLFSLASVVTPNVISIRHTPSLSALAFRSLDGGIHSNNINERKRESRRRRKGSMTDISRSLLLLSLYPPTAHFFFLFQYRK